MPRGASQALGPGVQFPRSTVAGSTRVARRAGTYADIHVTDPRTIVTASSVSGWYFNHPASKYFGVGKIGKDQIEEYAKRKGFAVAETEKWLGPYLDYDPV